VWFICLYWFETICYSTCAYLKFSGQLNVISLFSDIFLDWTWLLWIIFLFSDKISFYLRTYFYYFLFEIYITSLLNTIAVIYCWYQNLQAFDNRNSISHWYYSVPYFLNILVFVVALSHIHVALLFTLFMWMCLCILQPIKPAQWIFCPRSISWEYLSVGMIL